MTASPLPPSDTLLGITTVMAGQVLRDLGTGAETIAPVDLVMLTAHVGGVQRASYQMTPAEAMAVAKALSAGCGKLISAEIDDDGKPLSWWERLTRLGNL